MTADLVKAAEKRDIEIDLDKAIRLMECATCAAQQINVHGTRGIVAALLEASNTLNDVMEKLGIIEPEEDA